MAPGPFAQWYKLGEFRPLSPSLTGPALPSKAAEILQPVRLRRRGGGGGAVPRGLPAAVQRAPEGFASRSPFRLRDPHGTGGTRRHPGGEEEAAAYIVARGELEVSRRSSDGDGKPLVMARLGTGSFFGEMALLSQLPGAASVIATRPSILLVARREALEAVVEERPTWRSSSRPTAVVSPWRTSAGPRRSSSRFRPRRGRRSWSASRPASSRRGTSSSRRGRGPRPAPHRVGRDRRRRLRKGRARGPGDADRGRDGGRGRAASLPERDGGRHRGAAHGDVVPAPRGVLCPRSDHPAILHGLYAIAVRRHPRRSSRSRRGPQR